MTKMAAMPISGKSTLKIFFPENTGLILMKLYMKHQKPKPFMFCSNNDPDLFHGKVKFFNLVLNGKGDNDGFFENYCIM